MENRKLFFLFNLGFENAVVLLRYKIIDLDLID